MGAGITTGHPDSLSTFDNVISGNTVIGYNLGIAAYQRDIEIYDNTLIGFSVGIQPKDVKNMNIYRNKFDSDNSASIGIFGNLTSMENVDIYENEMINVGREGIKMVYVNTNAGEENFNVTIDNNEFNSSSITLSRSIGVDYTNNDSDKGVTLVNAKNMNITGNTIFSDNQDGIRLLSGCKNINIANNNIGVCGNGVNNINIDNNNNNNE